MRARRSDAGFTLTELLLAVGILGMIAPVITGATIVGWQTTDATIGHLKDTGNRQLVQAWFVRDSQSAATVDVSAATTTCLSAGDTLVIRMSWADTVSGATVNRVAAYVRTGSAPAYQVVRRSCDNTGGTMANRGNTTLARLVTAAPTAACYTATGAATASCASARSMTLTVTDAGGSFTSTGRRRSL